LNQIFVNPLHTTRSAPLTAAGSVLTLTLEPHSVTALLLDIE
jgi:hypothetical protein